MQSIGNRFQHKESKYDKNVTNKLSKYKVQKINIRLYIFFLKNINKK